MSLLKQNIRDAHAAGRTALIPFVTAGFPTPDCFWGIIEELDANGADVIEIGVPFSDPVADGPVVEDASRRALEQGITLHWIMDGLLERAGRFKAGLVLTGLPESLPPVRAGALRRRCRRLRRLRLHRARSAAGRKRPHARNPESPRHGPHRSGGAEHHAGTHEG